jgi:hypothetical protein
MGISMGQWEIPVSSRAWNLHGFLLPFSVLKVGEWWW